MRNQGSQLKELLAVKCLTKAYGEQAVLSGVDLKITKGERVAIMGPSGSGKSTLLTCIAGLEEPESGEIRIDGRDLMSMNEAKRADLRLKKVASIFQFFHLLPTLRAYENIEFPLLLNRENRRSRENKVRQLLDEIGLTHRATAWPSELSGGEMQRLAIARALVTEPSLILADEPTGSLDSANSEGVLRLLDRLTRTHGASLLMVTHDAKAAGICDRLIHMSDGRLVESAAAAVQ